MSRSKGRRANTIAGTLAGRDTPTWERMTTLRRAGYSKLYIRWVLSQPLPLTVYLYNRALHLSKLPEYLL